VILSRSVHHATLALLFLLSACSHRMPQTTVEIIDTSLSITPSAKESAFNAVEIQILHMRRGDRLVLIPITGDAANDSGGHVLRFSAPTEREAYDTDLHRFQEQARKQFAGWSASLDQRQYRTDILGALEAARQEFAVLPAGGTRKLIIVSDFLEDDGTYRFVSDSAMASPARARQLAARAREQRNFTHQRVTLCLGRLESSDFARLSIQRKAAIQAFWTVYLAEAGEPTDIRFDGTGLLADTERGCSGMKP